MPSPFNAALIAIGPRGVVILGPHSTRDSGFCWCQPRLERVVHAGSADGPHDDYVIVHEDRVH